MSLCGLHRRRRGAIVGHLALFEMTSSIPNRRYAQRACAASASTRRATAFFDEHVEADAVHEAIAARRPRRRPGPPASPRWRADILWGARALVAVEARWAAHVLGRLGGRRQLAAARHGPVRGSRA